MKKLFLLSIAIGLSMGSFAQSTVHRHFSGRYTSKAIVPVTSNALYRTTTVGTVDTLTHISIPPDTLTMYYAGATLDSGWTSGMDFWEDMGFAERYEFNSTDSTLQVIGMIARFGGTVNPASTKTVNLEVWSAGPQTVVDATRPHLFYSGLPNNLLTSKIVPFTNLGIGTTIDTPKIYMFTTPTTYLTDTFFVGCELNYTWAGAAGDTIGIYNTLDGERTSAKYIVSGADTFVNDVNVTEFSDNTWHDNAIDSNTFGFWDNFGISNNFFLFPLVKVGHGLSVKGITNKNLTFFGNYPNPAVTGTNIKFSLTNSTDITIQVMDISGRVINTMKQKNLSPGEHIITLETANMATGDYVYVIHTTDGGGIAGKMTVIK